MRRAIGLALAAATLSLIAAPEALPAKEAPKTIELPAISDTWVEEAAPDAAHGTERDLVARFKDGSGTRILLGFDFSEIRGAHINSAQLQLTLKKAETPAIQMAASGLIASWIESTTWTDQPDRTRTYSLIEVANTPGAVTWDVTQLLNDTIEATDSLPGIALSGPVVGSATRYSRTFAARESGGDGPMLSIEYVPGAAVRPSPSPEAGRTVTPTAEESPPGATGVRIALATLAALVVAAIVVLIFRRRRRGATPSSE